MARANDAQWLPALGLAFLTYNSAAAVYRSIDDPWAVSFVVVAYVDLLLLFWCLRKFERSTESNRGGLKAAVWFLATLLTGMFAHKVAAIMPWPVAAIVYCMAAATAGGGFWAFFIYREPVDLSLDAKPSSNYREPVDLSLDAKPSSNYREPVDLSPDAKPSSN